MHPLSESKAEILCRRCTAGAPSALCAKNDVHDALHFTEPLRVQIVGNLDVFLVRPSDLKGEAFGCELNEPETEMASIGIVIVGLNVTDAAIIVLKLTLDEQVGGMGPHKSQLSPPGGSVSNET
jgi:hypothetical protein